MKRLLDILRPDDIDPESRNRTLLVGGIVLVVAFAFVLVAVGYYIDRIEPRGEIVFTVGDRGFSYTYLEDRVNAATAQGFINLNNLQFGIAQVISDIQNEELTRLIAAERGITVTPEEIEAGMREDVGASMLADHNLFATALRIRLLNTGLSLARYEEVIEADVLEQKIKAEIRETIPEEMEQVDLSVIRVETDAAATAARHRIAGGEAFEDVASEVSQHTSASAGGALGWTPRDLLQEDLAELAFTLEPDTLSAVLETERGFYILFVHGREVREVTDDTRFALVQTYFGDQLQEATERYELTNNVTVGHAQRIANQLRINGG